VRLGWYSDYGRRRIDVPGDQGAGTDDRGLADVHAGQDRGTSADVRVVTDFDAGAARRQAASAVAYIGVRDEHDAHRDRDPIADSDRARKVDEHFTSEVTVVTDLQIGKAGFRIVNDHPPQEPGLAANAGAFGSQDGDCVFTVGVLEKPQDLFQSPRGADGSEV
jgi:hypothetical protein